MTQKLLRFMVLGVTAIAGYLAGITTIPTAVYGNNREIISATNPSNRVLQINFKYNTSASEFRKQMLKNAPRLASVRGLKWKIWSMDEANKEASGYYLFESETALNSYLNNVFFVGMGDNPTVSNIVIKKFEILQEPTAITRGPIGKD